MLISYKNSSIVCTWPQWWTRYHRYIGPSCLTQSVLTLSGEWLGLPLSLSVFVHASQCVLCWVKMRREITDVTDEWWETNEKSIQPELTPPLRVWHTSNVFTHTHTPHTFFSSFSYLDRKKVRWQAIKMNRNKEKVGKNKTCLGERVEDVKVVRDFQAVGFCV